MERHKIIPGVSVVIKRDNKILLLKRSQRCSSPGLYCTPGGHAEAHETLRQAAAREAFEEIGIQVAVVDLVFTHLMHHNAERGECLITYFTAQKWQGEPYNKEPDIHDDMGWFDVNQLPENILISNKVALEKSDAGIYYSEYGWI